MCGVGDTGAGGKGGRKGGGRIMSEDGECGWIGGG